MLRKRQKRAAAGSVIEEAGGGGVRPGYSQHETGQAGRLRREV